jgi:hypothetical protein
MAVALLASISFSKIAAAEPPGNDEVVSISICELLAASTKYNHVIVKLAGNVSHGFEGFVIGDDACPKESIWLEYGGLKGSGTVFAGGPSPERTRTRKLEIEGIETSLIEDRQFKAFDRQIQKRSIQVNATLIGRYFAGESVAGPFGSFQGGYGHLGMYSLLVIQQVVESGGRDPGLPRPVRVDWGLVKHLLAIVVVAIIAGVIAWSLWPDAPLAAGNKADLVLVHKAARRLELYRGNELLKAYRVSLGRHPLGTKTQQGDGRTPEGDYRLDYRNPNSSFHKALHISYPEPGDIASARSRNVDPGGLVMLHGMRNGFGWIGKLHRAID